MFAYTRHEPYGVVVRAFSPIYLCETMPELSPGRDHPLECTSGTYLLHHVQILSASYNSR